MKQVAYTILISMFLVSFSCLAQSDTEGESATVDSMSQSHFLKLLIGTDQSLKGPYQVISTLLKIIWIPWALMWLAITLINCVTAERRNRSTLTELILSILLCPLTPLLYIWSYYNLQAHKARKKEKFGKM